MRVLAVRDGRVSAFMRRVSRRSGRMCVTKLRWPKARNDAWGKAREEVRREKRDESAIWSELQANDGLPL